MLRYSRVLLLRPLLQLLRMGAYSADHSVWVLFVIVHVWWLSHPFIRAKRGEVQNFDSLTTSTPVLTLSADTTSHLVAAASSSSSQTCCVQSSLISVVNSVIIESKNFYYVVHSWTGATVFMSLFACSYMYVPVMWVKFTCLVVKWWIESALKLKSERIKFMRDLWEKIRAHPTVEWSVHWEREDI